MVVSFKTLIWFLGFLEKCFGWVSGTQVCNVTWSNSNSVQLGCIQPSALGNLKSFFFLITCRWNSAGNKRAEKYWTSHEEHVKWLDKAECVDQQEQQQLHRATIWQHYHREWVHTLPQGTEAQLLISRSQTPRLFHDWAFERFVLQVAQKKIALWYKAVWPNGNYIVIHTHTHTKKVHFFIA